MNLINDPWLMVRRENGEKDVIEPWRVTDKYNSNPVVELAFPRADFNGSLTEFLIALLQTAYPFENPRHKRTLLKEPPAPETLKEAFEPIAYAFELDGDGPRFMQEEKIGNFRPVQVNIGKLLIDYPGENTERTSKDIFVKRNTIDCLCLPCSSAALFTHQLNAPGGGGQKRANYRGPSHITTLVLGDTLWETSWLNVIEDDNLNSLATPELSEIQFKLPWLTDPITSENDRLTTRIEINPLHILWAIPRRVLLNISTTPSKEKCDVCGDEESSYCKSFMSKGLGHYYAKDSRHPLSPYYESNGIPNALNFKDGYQGYKNWLNYTLISNEQNKTAICVSEYIKIIQKNANIWAFGFELEQEKCRAWHESTVPVLYMDGQTRSRFVIHIEKIIGVSSDMENSLIESFKECFKYTKKIGKDKKKEKKYLSYISDRFWMETESIFFGIIDNLHDAVRSDNQTLTRDIIKRWRSGICIKVLYIFDEFSQVDLIERKHIKALADARLKLRNIIYGDEISQKLGVN